MTAQEIHFTQLMELFAKHGIPAIPLEQIQQAGGNLTFAVSGARGSIIRYRLWGDGIVNVWMGKADSDSGGLAMQGQVPNGMEDVLRLHKRFAASGRRKVLRRAERAPYGL
jgi:hypothetical protein